MTIEYLEEGNPKVCEKILRSLPDWFGIEESTVAYIEKSKELPMIVAFDGDIPAGFLSLKQHSLYTSEIYVMGVSPEHHRKSIGKKLVAKAEQVLKNQNIEFFQVKTLSEDRECESYKSTRLFYKSQGFKEVEVFPTLWGEANPCLLMIKHLDTEGG